MKTLFIVLFLGLAGYLFFIAVRMVYRRKTKQENDRRAKMSAQQLAADKEKSLGGLRNTLTVLIPGAALMVLQDEYGWVMAAWISVGLFIVGRLLFGYFKKRGDY